MLNIIDISIRHPVLFTLCYLHSPPFGGVGGGFWEAFLLQTKPYSVRLNLCHHRQ